MSRVAPREVSMELGSSSTRVALALALVAGCTLSTSVARGQAGELDSIYVSPALPTTADAIVMHVITLCTNPFPDGPVVFGHTITLQATFLFPPCAAILPPQYDTAFPLPHLEAGVYTVQAIGGDVNLPGTGAIVYTTTFTVAEPASLRLIGDKFEVKILHGAVVANGTVVGGESVPSVRLSDGAGFFWFYDSANPEVTVKLLDARGLNGHFWFF